MKQKGKLTKRQRDFANHYIKTGNAAESARKAGYKGEYAHTAGRTFMSKESIKRYIGEKMAAVAEAEGIDVKRFIRDELFRLSTGPDVYEDSTHKGDTVTRSNPNKIRAIELLAKISGMMTEKVEVTGKDGGAIKIEWPNDSNPAT